MNETNFEDFNRVLQYVGLPFCTALHEQTKSELFGTNSDLKHIISSTMHINSPILQLNDRFPRPILGSIKERDKTYWSVLYLHLHLPPIYPASDTNLLVGPPLKYQTQFIGNIPHIQTTSQKQTHADFLSYQNFHDIPFINNNKKDK